MTPSVDPSACPPASPPDRGSADPAMLAACYDEVRVIARRLLAGRGERVMIQPTELANEAVLRLLRLDRMRFESRAHLLATAARLTRQALVDEARRAGRLKRRAPEMMTALPDAATPVRLEDLNLAVERLADVSPDHAELVELRFTLGLTVEEAAEVTGLSPRTVKRRWAATRAWLQAWLDGNAGDG